MRSRLFLAAIPLFWGVSAAHATVHVAIDLTHQRMHVNGDEGSYDWPISSARSGFSTPGGSYAPTHLELMHYSKKYHMSPMPHAIFFRGGYAIHGTYDTASLGRAAGGGSHLDQRFAAGVGALRRRPSSQPRLRLRHCELRARRRLRGAAPPLRRAGLFVSGLRLRRLQLRAARLLRLRRDVVVPFLKPVVFVA